MYRIRTAVRKNGYGSLPAVYCTAVTVLTTRSVHHDPKKRSSNWRTAICITKSDARDLRACHISVDDATRLPLEHAASAPRQLERLLKRRL